MLQPRKDFGSTNQRQMKLASLQIRRPLVREFLIFGGFLILTVLMTWPWVLHLHNAVPDTGDPYAISYLLWWDFHQTFHDPLNLFQATFFYPYHSTLAFGEFDYGVSLLFFPLFALGLRPLTVYSLAAFLSFPFTGYATLRLARTLSGSIGIAWIAGIIMAFLPFRFHHLAHLHLIFVGWVPLLFEALILFARQRSWKLAAWLGFAFFMNALTCTTWFILTIIPLILSATVLLTRNNAWRDRRFWLRAAATLCLASLFLLPFLLPVRRVAAEHGFTRTPEEVGHYSARFINWLAPDERSRAWRGFGTSGVDTEMVLFPGLMAPLLAIAAVLLSRRKFLKDDEDERPALFERIILALLDLVAISAGIVAFLTLGYDVIRFRLFGHLLLYASGPDCALTVLAIVILVRCLLAYPRFLRNALGGDRNLSATLNAPERSELFGQALIWIVIGFAGSFGLNFFFHKFLYLYVPVFRGMRVTTRWGMICYVGLVLVAGLGAKRIAEHASRWWPRFGKPLLYALIVAAILIDLHAAPLQMIQGEADPDAVTQDLKSRRMSGGILELPIGNRDHVYMLRAADHGHPIVNGRYSFVPPLQKEIEQIIAAHPIADTLMDELEGLPVSYVTVHRGLLEPGEREALQSFLNRNVAAGRLRLVQSFPAALSEGPGEQVDLYVVTKTEPGAVSENRQSQEEKIPLHPELLCPTIRQAELS